MKDPLTSRIFIGVLITHVIKHQLFQNLQWKEALIGWQAENEGFRVIRFENKEYFGKAFTHLNVDLPKVKKTEKELREIMLTYCPELTESHIKTFIFSQIWVT